MKFLHLFLLGSLFALFSCESPFLPEERPNDPLSNFESLWTTFDQQYGLFPVKSLDWDSVYATYLPQLNASSTEQEVYEVLVEVLTLLDDSHVALVPTNPELPFFQSGALGRQAAMNDFDLEIVKEQYLSDMQRIESFTVGLLPGNIGYLHIEGFGGLANDFQRSMEEVMAILGETNGLIIDVRGGYGGEDLAGQFIAGHFTETTLPYMQTRIKNGPAEADFTDWMEWEVRPEGTQAYTQPIMVLTHRFTISARETFCMAMKVLPQVQFVGDTTTGAFSNQINRELPNGWGYSVSIGDWRDPDGISYESIGLPPDMVVLNQREELLLGQDHVLEKALEMLE